MHFPFLLTKGEVLSCPAYEVDCPSKSQYLCGNLATFSGVCCTTCWKHL